VRGAKAGRLPPLAPVRSAAALWKGGFIRLDLFGLREVLHALGLGELGQARQRRCRGEALGVEQDQARGTGLLFTARGGGERVPDPGHGAAHRAQVDVLALQAQVAIPGSAFLYPLGERAHEREVAPMELARGCRFFHGARGTLGACRACQNFHHGRGALAGGGGCSARLPRTRRRSSTSSMWATP